MKTPLIVLAFLAGIALAPVARAADAFPTKPIRLVVPFGAAGITDLVARIVAEQASTELGQRLVIDNRSGANGNLAGELVAKSPADGYTLLFATLGMLAVNPVIYQTMSYSPDKDLEPIALLASTPHVFVMHPSTSPRSLSELATLTKAEPLKLTYGTAGIGSAPHLTQILLQSITGGQLLDVHYRSGAAGVAAVLSGEVSMTAEATPVVIEHVKAGGLRALAVASRVRVDLLPDLPTAAEAGFPGLENGSQSGVVGPRGLPPEVKQRIAEAFLKAVQAPATKTRLVAQGTIALAGNGPEFEREISLEKARWAPLLGSVRAQ